MPWVKFLRDYDHRPLPRVIKSYRRGQVRFVTRLCAQEVVGSGVAVLSSKEESSGG